MSSPEPLPARPSPSGRKSFALRLDPALHAALERLAAAELRSVNAQIELLLRDSLTRRGVRLAPVDPARRGRPPRDPASS